MARGLEVLVDGLYFPESLRWRDGELWFSDVFGRRVVKLQGSEAMTVVQLDGYPSGLGWLPDGDLLVVSMSERTILRLTDGTLVPYADLSSHMDWPANDMLVTSSGRAFVGSYGFDVDNGADPEKSRIISIDPDGTVLTEDALALFPNGFAVSSDGSRLYVAETFADRISTFDIGLRSELRNGHVFAQLPEGYGPDGICLDVLGRLWVACAFASRVLRINREGNIDAEVDFPGEGVYCCVVSDDPSGRLIVALASLDEEVAQRTPTGRIVAIDIH